MTTLNYARGSYYSHSGRFSPAGTLIALVGSIAAAILLGALYAYIDLYNPFISAVTILATAGLGLAIGLVTGRLLRFGKNRNIVVTSIVAALAALAGLYSSWIFWVYALLLRLSDDDPLVIGPIDLVTHPHFLWAVIVRINQVGAWSMGHAGSGHTVNGTELWFFWIGEAILIVGVSIFTAFKTATTIPFCENCGQWTSRTKDLPTTAVPDARELKARLEAKDLSYLEALARHGHTTDSWLALELFDCAGCMGLHALNVDEVRQVINRKGKAEKKTKRRISGLLLSADEANEIRGLPARISQPLPQPPASNEEEQADIEESAEERT